MFSRGRDTHLDRLAAIRYENGVLPTGARPGGAGGPQSPEHSSASRSEGQVLRYRREHPGEVVLHRRRGTHVAACGLGQEPAVLQDLVEDLRVVQPATQLRRDGRDHRIVDLGEPPGRRDRLPYRLPLRLLPLGAAAGDVVEMAA